jgi:hypothetical protein
MQGWVLTMSSMIHFMLRVNCIYRPATATKLRVRRPLHHGSLASRAPVVPLPRFAGADGASAPVLATHLRPSFADQSHEAFASEKIRGGGAPKRRNCPVGPRHASDVAIQNALRARPRVQRDALAFRRSTAALAPANCRSSIQAALHAMQREGVTSTLASRLSEAPRAPVIMPAGSMPGPPESGSDEPPPAGTASAPSVGVTG